MTRESFVFYRSFMEAIEMMRPEDQLECYKAITQYALDGTIPESGVARGVLLLSKPIIDKNNTRYENSKGSKKKANDERTASEPQANDERTASENEQYVSVSVSDSVSDSVSESEKKKEKRSRAAFVKPTVEEVREYCMERKNNVDPDAFVDFYDSKGWKVGKEPMKDWKAAVRTWEKRESREPPKGQPRQQAPPKWQYQDQRTYDYDELEKRLLARTYG